MTSSEPAGQDPAHALLALYDRALPQVYGYLLRRCGGAALAEDLTADTFLAAVHAIDRDRVDAVSVAWLIGIARHKLVDHWRRQAREERRLRLAANEPSPPDDPWAEVLDRARAAGVLAAIGAQHRAALVLRYVDGLPVADVAAHLGRTLAATEALLTRAKSAFRTAYESTGRRADGD
ncbi:MAG: sigma-70 family polymerase sigma factor [Acidimicrobiales bacterium]|nr:sigma-70 family polymerase sigma factor [Acidimicrobiales bacterium]